MKLRAALAIGLSALALGSTAVGLAQASAGTSKTAAQAADAAAQARAALTRHDPGKAIGLAEAAVAGEPQSPVYRALLGEAYLAAGRFVSARQILEEALAIDPASPRVALNLALAQTATGDWAAAKATLDAHADTIPVGDLGLAIALAGDPARAVELLTTAARGPAADAKIRQNLALSLALAGRWPEARAIAAVDVAPDVVDKRILQWAELARPHAAGDQVAALLGVRPVEDAGRPIALALAADAPQLAAAEATPAPAPAEPVDAFMPGRQPAPAEAAQVAASAPAPAPVAATTDTAPPATQPAFASVTFAPRQEIVQAVPATVRIARAAPAMAPVVTAAREPAKGDYFVQLGAYENSGVARDGWRRIAARMPSLAGHGPSGASVTTKAGSFYRLSIGGFSRPAAVSMCLHVRAGGGRCFVRAGAGDQVASWAKGTQVASR